MLDTEIDYKDRGFYTQNIILLIVFFTVTPLTLLASGISLLSLGSSNMFGEKVTPTKTVIQAGEAKKALFYASANKSLPSVSAEIVAGDARPQLIYEYLEKANSPLTPYAEKIVETADKYGLDYRLIPAIAQKESGLCRRIPEGSHNCWGWGIHSKGTLMFDNYDEALEIVSKGLREKYLDQGYVTPDQIMKKYAHPDSTTWAEGVNMYMDQME